MQRAGFSAASERAESLWNWPTAYVSGDSMIGALARNCTNHLVLCRVLACRTVGARSVARRYDKKVKCLAHLVNGVPLGKSGRETFELLSSCSHSARAANVGRVDKYRVAEQEHVQGPMAQHEIDGMQSLSQKCSFQNLNFTPGTVACLQAFLISLAATLGPQK